MENAIEITRPLPGYVLISSHAKLAAIVEAGVQLFVYRRPRWGDMWFVKE